MALQGINLPLAFTGQEAVWQKVFQVPFLLLISIFFQLSSRYFILFYLPLFFLIMEASLVLNFLCHYILWYWDLEWSVLKTIITIRNQDPHTCKSHYSTTNLTFVNLFIALRIVLHIVSILEKIKVKCIDLYYNPFCWTHLYQ